MDGNMRAELCKQALENTCRNNPTDGAIVHSDRGDPFTSRTFRVALQRPRLIQSMSGAGRCYGNVRKEGFFATLKNEKFYRMDTAKLSQDTARSAVFRHML